MDTPIKTPFIAIHDETAIMLLGTNSKSAAKIVLSLINYYYGDGSSPELPFREKIIYDHAIEKAEKEREKYFNKNESMSKARESRKKSRTETALIQDSNNTETTTETTLKQDSISTETTLKQDRNNTETMINPNPNPNPNPTISKDIDKPVKHKHGEYKNVMLTDDELDKLKAHTGYTDYIERLSSYMASTGKAYKSHYVTILNWMRKDKDNAPEIKSSSIDDDMLVVDNSKTMERLKAMYGGDSK